MREQNTGPETEGHAGAVAGLILILVILLIMVPGCQLAGNAISALGDGITAMGQSSGERVRERD